MNSLYSGGGKEGNDMKIGFIGAGNMASSLIGGMIQSGMVSPGDAAISDRDMEKLSVWKEKGVFVTADNAEIEERSDLIVFAVKPNVIAAVLDQMQGGGEKIYVSIAAGSQSGIFGEPSWQ